MDDRLPLLVPASHCTAACLGLWSLASPLCASPSCSVALWAKQASQAAWVPPWPPTPQLARELRLGWAAGAHPQRGHSPTAQRQRLLGLDPQQLEAERKKPPVKERTGVSHSRCQCLVLEPRAVSAALCPQCRTAWRLMKYRFLSASGSMIPPFSCCLLKIRRSSSWCCSTLASGLYGSRGCCGGGAAFRAERS